MLNFFPSPVECLIYRANLKPDDMKQITHKKEYAEEGGCAIESSRKILNEMSNTSNIINSPNRELIRFNQIDKTGIDSKDINRENDESGNKKAVELRNLESYKNI